MYGWIPENKEFFRCGKEVGIRNVFRLEMNGNKGKIFCQHPFCTVGGGDKNTHSFFQNDFFLPVLNIVAVIIRGVCNKKKSVHTSRMKKICPVGIDAFCKVGDLDMQKVGKKQYFFTVSQVCHKSINLSTSFYIDIYP